MIPFQALLNPLYSIMSKLHLLNTVPSMVLIYATFQSPFCIYMMKNAFDMVPDSLLESAKLDGAGDVYKRQEQRRGSAFRGRKDM